MHKLRNRIFLKNENRTKTQHAQASKKCNIQTNSYVHAKLRTLFRTKGLALLTPPNSPSLPQQNRIIVQNELLPQQSATSASRHCSCSCSCPKQPSLQQSTLSISACDLTKIFNLACSYWLCLRAHLTSKHAVFIVNSNTGRTSYSGMERIPGKNWRP